MPFLSVTNELVKPNQSSVRNEVCFSTEKIQVERSVLNSKEKKKTLHLTKYFEGCDCIFKSEQWQNIVR